MKENVYFCGVMSWVNRNDSGEKNLFIHDPVQPRNKHVIKKVQTSLTCCSSMLRPTETPTLERNREISLISPLCIKDAAAPTTLLLCTVLRHDARCFRASWREVTYVDRGEEVFCFWCGSTFDFTQKSEVWFQWT